jgi:hypothetical protein
LSPNDPLENHMLATTSTEQEKSGFKLLGFSADCRQLADLHAGKRSLLDGFAQYGTSLRAIDKVLPASIITEGCAAMRAQGHQILSDKTQEMNARLDERSTQIKPGEVSFLGVLAEDPDACYIAILKKTHTEAGTDVAEVNVVAQTLAKGKLVYVSRLATYAGPDTLTDSLEKLKVTVAALHAANK